MTGGMRIKNNLGQTLIEFVVGIPFLFVLLFFFFYGVFFISETFLLKVVLYQECRKFLVETEENMSKERLKASILKRLSLLPLKKKLKFSIFENNSSFLNVKVHMNYSIPWTTLFEEQLSREEECVLEK